MNPLERAREMLADAEVFNSEVREALPELTLFDAREIRNTCEEIRGWMAGVEMLLETK